jgi:hypothetical protein
MARKLPPKDVVIIGLEWTGSILGTNLQKPDLTLSLSNVDRGAIRQRIFRQPTGKSNYVTRCGSVPVPRIATREARAHQPFRSCEIVGFQLPLRIFDRHALLSCPLKDLD